MQGAKEKALCSFPVAILGEEASTRRHGDTEEEGAVSLQRGALIGGCKGRAPCSFLFPCQVTRDPRRVIRDPCQVTRDPC
jgi:hypothetical protein